MKSSRNVAIGTGKVLTVPAPILMFPTGKQRIQEKSEVYGISFSSDHSTLQPMVRTMEYKIQSTKHFHLPHRHQSSWMLIVLPVY